MPLPIAKTVTLAASAARTATGQATAVSGLSGYERLTVLLDVTVAATDGTDLLDVAIQRLLPDGSSWDTIGVFTQHAGDGGAAKYVMDIVPGSAAGDERAADGSTTSPTLAAGTVRNTPWGDQLRAIWIVVNGNAASFTFSVAASLS